MNPDRVAIALEPAVEQKRQAHADAEPMLPLLMVETKDDQLVIVGLAMDKPYWPEMAAQAAAMLGCRSLVFVADARTRQYRGEGDEGGVPEDDPDHIDCLVATGVDLDGAAVAVKLYRIADDGSLAFDETQTQRGSMGPQVEWLTEAFLAGADV